MGDYTEIYVNVDLKEGTPNTVLDVLRAMVNCEEVECLKPHPPRWSYLFNDGSCYTPRGSCANLTYDFGQYSLLAKGDIKNYGGEIEAFFEFIKPWCETEFMGFYKFESVRTPTLVYSTPEEEKE